MSIFPDRPKRVSKKYMSAVNALYGTISENPSPSTTLRRSTRYGQKKRLKRNIEQGIQIRLCLWMAENGISHFAIPNEGQRSAAGGHIAKQMGLRPGVSDLFITHARGGHHGYFVELKRPGERPRANQLEFLDAMRQEGYKAEWFDNLEAAKESIGNYMNGY